MKKAQIDQDFSLIVKNNQRREGCKWTKFSNICFTVCGITGEFKWTKSYSKEERGRVGVLNFMFL